jgi:hypothetical protein
MTGNFRCKHDVRYNVFWFCSFALVLVFVLTWSGTAASMSSGQASAGATTSSESPASTPIPAASPVSTPSAPSQGRSRLDSAVIAANTIRDFLKDSLPWSLVLLIVLFYFRKPLAEFLRGPPETIGNRGVTIDVGTFKVD